MEEGGKDKDGLGDTACDEQPAAGANTKEVKARIKMSINHRLYSTTLLIKLYSPVLNYTALLP